MRRARPRRAGAGRRTRRPGPAPASTRPRAERPDDDGRTDDPADHAAERRPGSPPRGRSNRPGRAAGRPTAVSRASLRGEVVADDQREEDREASRIATPSEPMSRSRPRAASARASAVSQPRHRARDRERRVVRGRGRGSWRRRRPRRSPAVHGWIRRSGRAAASRRTSARCVEGGALRRWRPRRSPAGPPGSRRPVWYSPPPRSARRTARAGRGRRTGWPGRAGAAPDDRQLEARGRAGNREVEVGAARSRKQDRLAPLAVDARGRQAAVDQRHPRPGSSTATTSSNTGASRSASSWPAARGRAGPVEARQRRARAARRAALAVGPSRCAAREKCEHADDGQVSAPVAARARCRVASAATSPMPDTMAD